MVIFILFFCVNLIFQISSNDSVLVWEETKGKKWSRRSWTTLFLYSQCSQCSIQGKLINPGVSALFINSVQEEEILLKFHSVIKDESIFCIFHDVKAEDKKLPTAILLPIFLICYKQQEIIVCPIDLTKGKQANRYINISTFPSRLWLGHVLDFTLHKASY